MEAGDEATRLDCRHRFHAGPRRNRIHQAFGRDALGGVTGLVTPIQDDGDGRLPSSGTLENFGDEHQYEDERQIGIGREQLGAVHRLSHRK
ncbi:hypothetical protein PF003_g40475 [Phytophthora fragariae]|nr:hypothetical protein PF003_g40475 [Phytophthora fragariae]